MKKELERKLVAKYPVIFSGYGGDMRRTCMAWGMECGDGWYNILDELCQKIEDLIAGTTSEVVAIQVKEKFGGLRFYYVVESYGETKNTRSKMFWKIRGFFVKMRLWKLYDWLDEQRQKVYKTVDEKIFDAVNEAEAKSYKTCERCGLPGEANGIGWISTLCPDCRNVKTLGENFTQLANTLSKQENK